MQFTLFDRIPASLAGHRPALRPRIALACLLALTLAPAGALSAQEVASNGNGEAGAAAPENDPFSVFRPERASALDVDLARQDAERLKPRTLQDIRRLGVLVRNFGGDVAGAEQELETLKENYREAMRRYYLRRFISSQKKHREAHRQALALYEKFSLQFRRQLSELLAECSTRIVDSQMSQQAEPGVIAPRQERRAVETSQYKLHIAYQQSSTAEDLIRDGRPDAAIEHLRIAKLYAINVLESLEPDPAKKAEIRKKYATDLVDGEGLIADSSAAQPAGE